MVSVRDHVQVVFNHDDGCAFVYEPLQNSQEGSNIEGMEADAGFVENEDGFALVLMELRSELQPLRFSSGECRSTLSKGEVPQS